MCVSRHARLYAIVMVTLAGGVYSHMREILCLYSKLLMETIGCWFSPSLRFKVSEKVGLPKCVHSIHSGLGQKQQNSLVLRLLM